LCRFWWTISISCSGCPEWFSVTRFVHSTLERNTRKINRA
jgi:hypothetical protein